MAYEGFIHISNEEDMKRFKRTDFAADVPDSVLEAGLEAALESDTGGWVRFDIKYLELFWFSEERKQILDEGLVLAIKKIE